MRSTSCVGAAALLGAVVVLARALTAEVTVGATIGIGTVAFDFRHRTGGDAGRLLPAATRGSAPVGAALLGAADSPALGGRGLLAIDCGALLIVAIDGDTPPVVAIDGDTPLVVERVGDAALGNGELGLLTALACTTTSAFRRTTGSAARAMLPVATRGSSGGVGNPSRAPVDELAAAAGFCDAARITVDVTAASDEPGAEADAGAPVLEPRPAARSGIRCSVPVATALIAIEGCPPGASPDCLAFFNTPDAARLLAIRPGVLAIRRATNSPAREMLGA